MAKPATSYEVAKKAGVSQSAVSRCFTPGASIAKPTRERIIKAADELGYMPNALAKGLSTQSSNLIALIVPSEVNLFFPELVAGLNQAITATGKHTLLFSSEGEEGSLQIARAAVAHAVDGVFSALTLSDHAAELLNNRNIPVVMLNRDARHPNHAAISTDQTGGARMLAQLLLDQGCTRIGVIAGPAYSPTNQQRMAGFLSLIEPLVILEGKYDYHSGRTLAAELWPHTPDAVFCANDAIALGLLDSARHDKNIRVPDQVRIVGFDDMMAAGWSSYELTTARQPIEQLIELAVKALARFDDPANPPTRQQIPCTIIRRQTC